MRSESGSNRPLNQQIQTTSVNCKKLTHTEPSRNRNEMNGPKALNLKSNI